MGRSRQRVHLPNLSERAGRMGCDASLMPCYRCGRVQTDPAKGASPWARGVVEGDQILICPVCQTDDPTWHEALDRCPQCGSTRLSMVMGSLSCRACDYLGGEG